MATEIVNVESQGSLTDYDTVLDRIANVWNRKQTEMNTKYFKQNVLTDNLIQTIRSLFLCEGTDKGNRRFLNIHLKKIYPCRFFIKKEKG